MINTRKFTKRFAVKLTAFVLCVAMIMGFSGISALSEAAENDGITDILHNLVDLYCSQTAKDALGYEQLETLVDLIVTSIEPQAVNLLIERFPCFREAAANDGLGREIGLYIYYGEGDRDGIDEHEDVAPGAYAYVNGYPVYENGKTVFKYMIGIDAETLCDDDDDNTDVKDAVLDLNGHARIQVDTTFCHELFHTFMYDYNRVGMTGFIDYASFVEHSADAPDIDDEGERLFSKTVFPMWFIEGLAGCVGNIYPADLLIFEEYHLDPDTQQYLDTQCQSLKDSRQTLTGTEPLSQLR